MSKSHKTYFIDTNIFLRALINDDKRKFNDVVEFLEGVKENRFKAHTSSLVLAEIVWTLLSFYKLKKEDVTKSVESIINLNGLTFVESQDSVQAMSLYKKHNVKYIDCLICSSLQKEQVVVSYDTDFDKLGAIRLEPKNLL